MSGYASGYARVCAIIAIASAVMCTDADVSYEADVDTGKGLDAYEGTTPSNQSASEIRYHLAWDSGEAQLTDMGWRVTNDRGYKIEVTEGYLVTYSVQLAPCSDSDLGEGFDLRRLFGVGHAWAGHGGPEDPSAWLTGIAEDLAKPQQVSLQPVPLNTGIYCRAHYLVARAESKARGLPDDFNMIGTSLYVAGTAALDDGEPEPFSIWSTLPIGELTPWTEPVSPIDISDGGVDVTITRDLGRLFDGIAFETMSAEGIEKTVLLGLASHLRVDVTQP